MLLSYLIFVKFMYPSFHLVTLSCFAMIEGIKSIKKKKSGLLQSHRDLSICSTFPVWFFHLWSRCRARAGMATILQEGAVGEG